MTVQTRKLWESPLLRLLVPLAVGIGLVLTDSAPALSWQILLFVSFFLLSWRAHLNISRHLGNKIDSYVYQTAVTLTLIAGSMLWCEVTDPETQANDSPAIQTRLIEQLQHPVLQPDTQHLLSAMLLGDKSRLDADMKQMFSRTGISHVLALSGLHIGVIVLLIGWLIPRRMPGRRLLLVGGTWVFIYVVGMPVSAIRAGIMLSLWLLHPFKDQQTLSLDVWALAAILMLLYHPYYLADIGFQLSFAAVGSIVFCQPFFFYTHYLPRKVQQWIWVCVTAQMGVMPLSIWYFGQVPILFLLTNALVTPILLPVLIYGGLVFLGCSYYFPTALESVGELLNGAVWLLLHIVQWVDAISFG